MAIDLSSMDFAQTTLAAINKPSGQPAGTAREIPLDEIDEDPNQPRKEFDQEQLDELAASIREFGVLQPIKVKPNPDMPGRWIIAYGARRFRASLLAGKTVIPALVGEGTGASKTTDELYVQGIENLQRADMTPKEVADFIQELIAAGESKKEIARRLGKKLNFITYHLSLVDAPAGILAAYEQGKTKSIETLYNLRNLHEKHPEQVSAWIAEQPAISRNTVEALADTLAGRNGQSEADTEAQQPASAPNPDATAASPGKQQPKASKGQQDRPERKISDETVAKVNFRPLLLVEVDGRTASVKLKQPPSQRGMLCIRYEDDSTESEVEAARCTILALEDGASVMGSLPGAAQACIAG